MSDPSSAGSATTEQIFITPDSQVDLTSVFACEDGDFEVFWSGVVYVPGTIHIGRGTTVNIFGDASDRNASLEGSGSDYEVEGLSTMLPKVPNGLTSAAVSTIFQQQQQQSNATSAEPDPDVEDGAALAWPLFFVDGGQLFLENLAVRGGDAGNYTGSSVSSSGSSGVGGDIIVSGGGVHAVDANVTVTGCEFEDNFAQHLGGGIFTNRSTLVVVGSVFRRCQADVVSSPGDDAVGAGGGIGVSVE